MFNKLKAEVIKGEAGKSQESEELFDTQKIIVKIQGGHLVATESQDPIIRA